ncbi:MAG: AlwI family type II restriction endonuclease [Dehalobacter sp. 4CP]|nr:AlwI family type II restriction endonuclease [Dehalobacter sp. 4CP]
MEFWQLGNTSVRSALRIRDGLIVLSKSTIQGNIRRGEGDVAFRKLLGESGIVSLGDDKTNSVGRKWRSAMGKLGFIYPEIKSGAGFTQSDVGPKDTITPAGYRLINSDTAAGIQECYLRAMVVPLIPTGKGTTFSPLCWVLAIMIHLENKGYEPALSFIELSMYVQTTTPSDNLDEITEAILSLRRQREQSSSKRVFDRELYKQKSKESHCAVTTFSDYADMNIRYLKATGMFQAKGKGIVIVPEKKAMAKQLAANIQSSKPLLTLYRNLCNGAALPTDNVDVAYNVLQDLMIQANNYNIEYSIEGKTLKTPAQINQVRFDIEQLISEKKEEAFAQEQASQWEEIALYMELLSTKKTHIKIDSDTEIRIPKAEAPAYLEWSLWRALLAIDSLENKPYVVKHIKKMLKNLRRALKENIGSIDKDYL